MSADFRFYLNRQGLRGQKGEKGDTGFSPSIVEEVNTLTDYRLKIINEFDEFVTDNLRGSDYFDVTDPNGTYLKYDNVSHRAYTGSLDQATGEAIGGAMLAQPEDIDTFNETKIVTPALFADSLTKLIISPDGSIDINQNEETSKTEIKLNSTALDSIRTELNGVKQDLITEAQVRLNADNQQQVAIDAERREREAQDAALQNQISSLGDNFVNIAGNQTITGVKTFSNRVNLDDSSYIMGLSDGSTLFAPSNNNGVLQIGSRFVEGMETRLEGAKVTFNYVVPQVHKDNGDFKVLTQDTVEQGDNITIERTTNGIKISSTGGGSGSVDIDDNTIKKNTQGQIYVNKPNEDAKSYTRRTSSDGTEAIVQNIKMPVNQEFTPSGEILYGQFVFEGPIGEQVDPLVSFRTLKEGNNIIINKNASTGELTIGCLNTSDVSSSGNNNFTGNNEFRGEDKLRVGNGTNYAVLANYSDEVLPVTGSDIQATEQLVIGTSYANTVLEGEDVYKRVWNTETGNMELSPIVDATMVDNQTIKFDNGELKADFSEIGDEVNTLAGKVNTLETKVDDLQLFKFPNATIEGDPTINNGQITDFSTTNYLRFPFEFKTEGRTWLLNGSFDTDTDVTTQQNIIDSLASVALAVRNGRLVLALSTNGTSFNLGEHESMSDILANTKYYYRLSFSGTQYLLSISTDKQEWLPEIIVTSDQPIASKPMTISSPGHPYKGTINLNDWDLTVANALVWQGMDDVGIASRMDVNASNITQTGIDKLKELLLGDVEALVDAINVNYESSNEPALAATPMMLSLETTELDVENSFTSNKSKAVFNEDMQITPLKEESYDDDTDIDLGGNV